MQFPSGILLPGGRGSRGTKDDFPKAEERSSEGQYPARAISGGTKNEVRKDEGRNAEADFQLEGNRPRTKNDIFRTKNGILKDGTPKTKFPPCRKSSFKAEERNSKAEERNSKYRPRTKNDILKAEERYSKAEEFKLNLGTSFEGPPRNSAGPPRSSAEVSQSTSTAEVLGKRSFARPPRSSADVFRKTSSEGALSKDLRGALRSSAELRGGPAEVLRRSCGGALAEELFRKTSAELRGGLSQELRERGSLRDLHGSRFRLSPG
eukprot:gene12407-biopygen4342